MYNGPLKELLIDTHEDGVAAYFFGGRGRILGPAGEKYWGGLKNRTSVVLLKLLAAVCRRGARLTLESQF